MNIFLIGIGGSMGSLARYSLGQYIQKRVGKYFPIGTLIINITGALILGILSAANLNSPLHYFLCDGFVGAYTTFSTFMFDSTKLIEGHQKLNALIYISISIIVGILFYTIGYNLIEYFI